MPSIELTDQVARDFKHVVDHLLLHNAIDAESRIAEILQAIRVLEANPRIGRSADGSTRELVIGSGSHDYLALYRHVVEMEVVLVLAIRSQRESDYPHD